MAGVDFGFGFRFGSLSSAASGGGVVLPETPFTADENTLWFDFTSSLNTYDTLGDDTLAIALELTQGERYFWQDIKDYQGKVVSGLGVTFVEGSDRHMVLESRFGLTRNKSGQFVCMNVNIPSVDGLIYSVNPYGGDAARGGLKIANTTGEASFLVSQADSVAGGAAASTVGAMTPSNWYTLAAEYDPINDTAKLWVNGALSVTGTGTFGAFADTDIKEFILGNSGIEGSPDAFDGVIHEMVWYDGVPSSTVRDEIIAYMQSSRFDVPDAPVINALSGNESINVVFDAPDAHNSPITDYEYRYALTGTGIWTTFSDGTSATAGAAITGVVNGTIYDVQARAVNAVGASAWSASSQVAPTATPGVPDAPTLSVVPGNTLATLYYTAPNNNGFLIDLYKHYYRTTGSTPWTLFNTTTSVGTIITGLTNGTGYDFKVLAHNSAGESADSNIVAATPSLPPDMQTVVSSCVMDIDVAYDTCYSGSGTLLENLVAAPADGSASSAYDVHFGDGSTATTFPTFGGTVNTPSAKLTFDNDDFMQLHNGNTAFANAMHKTTGGSPWTFVVFGKFVASTAQQTLMTTRNGSTATGITALLNSAEVMRIEQRGDSAVVTASPALTVATDGTISMLAFAGNGSQYSAWKNVTSDTATTATTGTHTYNASTGDAAQVMHFMASAAGTGTVDSGTEIYAMFLFNARLDDTQMLAVLNEYKRRRGL